MNRLVKFSMAALSALSMVAPAVAQDNPVVGVWQPATDSDYTASMCGPKGDRFCLKVTGLRDAMRKPEYLKYLNTNLIDQATGGSSPAWLYPLETHPPVAQRVQQLADFIATNHLTGTKINASAFTAVVGAQ